MTDQVLPAAAISSDSAPHEVLTFRCTPAQQRMWYLSQLDPAATAYNVVVSLRLIGSLSPEALQGALADVVARHEILRTTFVEVDGELLQVVGTRVSVDLDPRDIPAEALHGAVERLRAAPYDLAVGPLIRARLFRLPDPDAPVGPAGSLEKISTTAVLTIAMHHIIADGWSLPVLARDLFESYRARIDHRAPDLPEIDIQYGDYAEWLIGRNDAARRQRSLDFWRDYLRDAPRALEIAPARTAAIGRVDRGTRHIAEVDRRSSDRVIAFGRSLGLTLQPVLMAAVAATLFRTAGPADQVFGTLYAGRDRPEIEPLIGLFVNTLPIRVRLTGSESFTELSMRVAEECNRCWEHSDTPYDRIVAAAGASGGGEFTDIVCGLQGTSFDPTPVTAGLVAEALVTEATRTRFDLEFHWHNARDGIALALVHDVDRYRSDAIERLAERLVVLLRRACAEPDRPIADIDLFVSTDRRPHEAPPPVPAADEGIDVWTCWRKQYAADPDRTVLRDVDGTRVTRAQLHRNALACAARTAEVALPAARIAIVAGSAAARMAAVLAAYAAGGVPVLFDPESPGLDEQLRRVGPDLVLGDDRWSSELPCRRITMPPADLAGGDLTPADREPDRARPASTFLIAGVGSPILVDSATIVATVGWLAGPAAEAVGPVGTGGSIPNAMWEILRVLVGDGEWQVGGEPTDRLIGDPSTGAYLLAGDIDRDRADVLVGIGAPGIDIRDERGRPVPAEILGRVVRVRADGGTTDAGRSGWLLPDGRLAIVRPDPDTHLERGGWWAPGSAVEGILATAPGVRDSIAVARTDTAGARRIVAYVVPDGPVHADVLRRKLAAELPGPLVPDDIVPVNRIPLTGEGTPDLRALAALPVVGRRAAEAWEQAWNAGRQTADVAVLLEPRSPDLGYRRIPAVADRDEQEPISARTAPAFIDGGPAVTPDSTVFSEVLEKAARGRGGIRYIERWGEQTTHSYAELLAQARIGAAGLIRAGVRRDDPVIVVRDSNPQFVQAFWSCVLAGAAMAPLSFPPAAFAGPVRGELDPDHVAVRRLLSAWELLGRPSIVVADAIAPAVRQLFGQTPAHVLGASALATGDPLPGEAPVQRNPDDIALYMFTSGSTGTPKAVTISHRNMLSQIVGAMARTGLGAEAPGLCWMPMDHLAGLGFFHMADVYRGVEQTLIETDVILADPLRWLDAIDTYRVASSWAPNFMFGLVAGALREGGRQPEWDLGCVRSLLCGGEEVLTSTMADFVRAVAPYGLAAAAVTPAWGMAETSTGMTYATHAHPESGVFARVGRPIPGAAVRVTGADNAVLTEGEVGRLEVRGTNVTAGYHADPERNAEAFDADGWLDTGDSAMVLDGELVVIGRLKDEIVVNGANFHCSEMESVVAGVPGVTRGEVAVTAVRPGSTAAEVVAVFVSVPDSVAADDEQSIALAAGIRSTLSIQCGLQPRFVIPLAFGEIPKSILHKVQRAHLRDRLAAGEFDATIARMDRLTGSGADRLPGWFYGVTWVRGRSAGDSVDPRTPVLLIGGGLDRVASALGDRAVPYIPAAEVDPDPAIISDAITAGADRRLIICLRPGVDDDRSAVLEVHTLVRAIAAAVDRAEVDVDIRLVVLTFGAEEVRPEDSIEPGGWAVPGYVASVHRAVRGLSARSVDLDPADTVAVLGELDRADGERRVAYRGGRRYLPRLGHRAEPDGVARSLITGGMYVLIGGAGGIGSLITRRLLDHHDAAVVVIGRRPEPDADGAIPSDRLRYWSVASDIEDLQDRIDAFGRRVGRTLVGVFDLAGVYREGPVSELADADVIEPIETRMQTLAVARALMVRHRDAWLAVASSVSGHFGSPPAAGYAAACAWADRATARLNRELGADRCVSVALSRVDGVGMSSRTTITAEATTSHGYLLMDAETCWATLCAALADPAPQQLVAIDPSAPRFTGDIDAPAAPFHRLVAHRAARTAGSPTPPVPVDGYGHECPQAVVEHESLPGTAGSIDRDLLAGSGAAPRAGGAPVGQWESLVARVWSEVLGCEVPTSTSSFFELGGTSLTLVAVQHALREEGFELPLVELFRRPTVARLAGALHAAAASGAAESAPAEHLAAAPTGPAAGTGRHRGHARAEARKKARTGR
ncbi:SDR family NAD(P)-dependent oxidoreductase [Millisia brevis]|uniref:SDR family NAD(P)-dependent oxidoreductase n=1 Tax=Millisia brevis TaxID=264148 RepID=UPI00082C61FC|nr:SDR family NAD(P)-dependent oxidoreductase [Millisia brevis]